MTILSISAAARAAGVNRSTLQRAIRNGRLSATVDAAGERGIDTAELLRVFGPLQQAPPQETAAERQRAAPDTALVEALREQLREAQEREQQAQEREMRLLALLENEQRARHELEQKLLPAPKPVPPNTTRLWILLIVLVLAALALIATKSAWMT